MSMTISRKKTKLRISPDAEKLTAEAISLALSGSRIEDLFWETKLLERILKLLKNQNQAVIDAALDHAFKINPTAFEYLADAVEAVAESITFDYEGQSWDALLIALPIVVQTKYQIPSGNLTQIMSSEVAALLHRFVVAQDAFLSIVPWLYSIDQLPQSHSKTRQLLEKMSIAAVAQSELKLELENMPETISVLADPRFILATIVVPSGHPIFRWQEEGSGSLERSQSLKDWRENMIALAPDFLPGCEFEMLLPEAYFTNCREADKRVRPLSLKAAVNYLCQTLNVDPIQLACVVGAFGDEIVDEFRISFSLKGQSDLVYGVVWPLYDRESVSSDQLSDSTQEGTTLKVICDTLKSMGIQDVFKHAVLFPAEMCDDCGVPLFPDRVGDVVHAELPEDVPTQQPLFH
jgi:hypothetical protein